MVEVVLIVLLSFVFVVSLFCLEELLSVTLLDSDVEVVVESVLVFVSDSLFEVVSAFDVVVLLAFVHHYFVYL